MAAAQQSILTMRRQKTNGLEFLIKLPWQINAALGFISFIALFWVLPAVWASNPTFKFVGQGARQFAPFAPVFFGAMAIASAFFRKSHAVLVDKQTSIESLKNVGWKEFEYLVAEAFRRQGYQVSYNTGTGPDGGVDLTLFRSGQTSLVQCKQWKTFSVGVKVIREQFGIMTAEKAQEAIIVTTGFFSDEAKAFTRGKPIRLIDGPQLLALVQTVQR